MISRARLTFAGAFALLGATLSAPVGADQAETYDLQERPVAGAAWQSVVQQSNSTQVWAGSETNRDDLRLSTNTDSYGTLAYAITAADPSGGYSRTTRYLKLRFDKYRYDPKNGEQHVSIDSEEPVNPAQPAEFRHLWSGMMRNVLTENFDAQGRLISATNSLVDTATDNLLGSIAAEEISDDLSFVPTHAMRVGEMWQVGHQAVPAPFWSGGGSTVSYDLTGTLIAVESREGVRHALYGVVSSNWKQERTTNVAGPGISHYEFAALFEFDFASHRTVGWRQSETVRGFWFDLESNQLIYFERKNLARMTENGAPAWMIDER